jgi:hypothetical protein
MKKMKNRDLANVLYNAFNRLDDATLGKKEIHNAILEAEDEAKTILSERDYRRINFDLVNRVLQAKNIKYEN